LSAVVCCVRGDRSSPWLCASVARISDLRAFVSFVVFVRKRR
jgi:hypothetical protein